ncbi:MAG: LptF/LptG family permease [Tannerella sp.]|nr:LptF/LptG family permease [Tannerella sp.]
MRIKRLYIFLLKTFLPLFAMTFGICLFIVLMQFLWKYIDEMVGKGLAISILAEEFFYAMLSFVPMSLPLAVLLASLMTFGNLGEQSELLAMKAAGISLQRIMKPLIIFLCFVACGSFYFQNNIIPLSQVKMWTLMYSIKNKSPELEIPENTFYNEIMGYNIYVKKKAKNGQLKDMMIYDYSRGFNNAQVIMADSGRLKMATNKLYLILTLYNGEAFENLKDQGKTISKESVPYRKESFKTKEILIKFDANFNRANESLMQDRYIAKNLADLRRSIDSMTVDIDSIKRVNAALIYNASYIRSTGVQLPDTSGQTQQFAPLDFDSLYQAQYPGTKLSLLTQVRTRLQGVRMDYQFKSLQLASNEKEMRRHHTEMHKKFTYSLACLIFFFIGAPLGAIIRKGGLGMPVIISVLLFIFYYVIDNIGFKMASNGRWEPWQGMWLSSAILLPLGAFLTYKAANDSVLLNADTYLNALKKLTGQRLTRKIEKKEVIMYNVDYQDLALHVNALKQHCNTYLSTHKQWIPYFDFWKQGGKDADAEQLLAELELVVDEAANSDQNLVLNKLMDYPVTNWYQLGNFPNNRVIPWLLPLTLPVYGLIMYRRKWLIQDIRLILRISDELLDMIKK